jgi:hypothetical protein
MLEYLATCTTVTPTDYEHKLRILMSEQCRMY